ncbi:VCBS repeat-containing protein [Nannocystis sp. ILAH1]|uniref:FG-GAP repeat domain-containing protein n=1 Tax=unclassified Nannocystis TaxID=2627009 RepID=UPI0022715404|nr:MULTISPECIES: VCBS repeat-containing protein [unclassified Nannocystis]MCY0987542.1 VCBS repeat-containing protein [Nannocystis sp. ILAH1]MCY1070662.1 VCBS repeat-containing protein [Nannocystis sp. RBIL2]
MSSRTLVAHVLATSSLALAVVGCGDDGGQATAGQTTTATTVSTSNVQPTMDAPTSTSTTEGGSDSESGTSTGNPGTMSGTTTSTTGPTDPSAGTSSSTTDDTGAVKFDMPSSADFGAPPSSCKVVDDMDAIGDCTDKAPPDSFEPEAQWTFTGPPGFENCIVMPLVVNLTDDNADGEIDLCDIPDVVVVAGPDQGSDVPPSRLYVLDGATGAVHFFASEMVQFGGTPAAGDIDGDGIAEIVAIEPGSGGRLIAFEHDGQVKWKSNTSWPGSQSGSIALADIDQDGDVEIVAGAKLYDHNGVEIWTRGNDSSYNASAIADLDGQPGLEVLVGGAAFHADGSTWYDTNQFGWIFPQIANLDADPQPEVLLALDNKIELRQHDGTLVWNFTPNGQNDLSRPINIHDLDGDAAPEFGVSAPNFYGVYETNQALLWQAAVIDQSGQAGGTAFDFLGGGKAQAIYADEHTVWVFDEMGSPLMDTPHLSGTIIEYPVVADIDNDGSSEILVVSNTLLNGGVVPFTVQAVRDIQDRWVQGRRIWNQHTYHVTNVREDGTIPQFEPPHWTKLNTYRTQAQIAAGGEVCIPPQ